MDICLKKFFDIHSSFLWFSQTLILPASQLQTQQLMSYKL